MLLLAIAGGPAVTKTVWTVYKGNTPPDMDNVDFKIHSGMGVKFGCDRLPFNFTGVPTLKKGLFVKDVRDYHYGEVLHFSKTHVTIRNEFTRRNKKLPRKQCVVLPPEETLLRNRRTGTWYQVNIFVV